MFIIRIGDNSFLLHFEFLQFFLGLFNLDNSINLLMKVQVCDCFILVKFLLLDYVLTALFVSLIFYFIIYFIRFYGCYIWNP